MWSRQLDNFTIFSVFVCIAYRENFFVCMLLLKLAMWWWYRSIIKAHAFKIQLPAIHIWNCLSLSYFPSLLIVLFLSSLCVVFYAEFWWDFFRLTHKMLQFRNIFLFLYIFLFVDCKLDFFLSFYILKSIFLIFFFFFGK